MSAPSLDLNRPDPMGRSTDPWTSHMANTMSCYPGLKDTLDRDTGVVKSNVGWHPLMRDKGEIVDRHRPGPARRLQAAQPGWRPYGAPAD
jgi:hypothetical protein